MGGRVRYDKVVKYIGTLYCFPRQAKENKGIGKPPPYIDVRC